MALVAETPLGQHVKKGESGRRNSQMYKLKRKSALQHVRNMGLTPLDYPNTNKIKVGSMGRVSPVKLAPSSERSRHGCAVAIDPSQMLQLRQGPHCRHPASVLRSPAGTLCPEARGLSPQHRWEHAPRGFTAKSCFPCPLSHSNAAS